MESMIDRYLRYYSLKYRSKLVWANKKTQLLTYFKPMIGGKKEVTIADLGCGPCSITGSYLKNVKVNLYPSDILRDEYMDIWKRKCKVKPLIPIEYQDMENLTYEDEFFDIVHCVNSLDHTFNAKKAIKEMLRICKKGGWIYLCHGANQKEYFGGHHYWNIDVKGKNCIFRNSKKSFILEEFETTKKDGVITSTLLI